MKVLIGSKQIRFLGYLFICKQKIYMGNQYPLHIYFQIIISLEAHLSLKTLSSVYLHRTNQIPPGERPKHSVEFAMFSPSEIGDSDVVLFLTPKTRAQNHLNTFRVRTALPWELGDSDALHADPHYAG